VVLKGAGRWTLRVVCLTAVTLPGEASFEDSVARVVGETLLLVESAEALTLVLEIHLHHPEGFGHKGAPFLLSLGYEDEGGRLHPADA
jgi:hypothetical protein